MNRLATLHRTLATSTAKQTFHGGRNTQNIVTNKAEQDKLVSSANTVVDLTERQSCDVELIMNGGLSPLDGFMNRDTYESVVNNHRLSKDGLLFGLPVVLDTDQPDVKPGNRVLLRYQGTDMAVIDVADRYTPNKPHEAKMCYRTTSIEHPGVCMITGERKSDYVGGKITGLNLPTRPFPCKTPAEVRASLPAGVDVVAFQNRNPVHRAHYELFIRALDAPNVDKAGGAVVLVHPTMGPTQDQDISGVVRYTTYKVLQAEMNNPRVHWAFLPYSMHMAGPREALQHMLMRKNFGCTHFIIGRDMAGSKSSLTGEDYYGAYDAQDFAKSVSEELGMKLVPSQDLVYTVEKGYLAADEAKKLGLKVQKLSGTEFRRKLRAGEEIPDWFAFKSVVDVLRRDWK
ncbi:sulfate adenylyltransferase [Batrachochytrium salamandrivorans]|nr:sulfate adenylyltransferase [Batrachochytrium salamandrivorans]